MDYDFQSKPYIGHKCNIHRILRRKCGNVVVCLSKCARKSCNKRKTIELKIASFCTCHTFLSDNTHAE